MEALVRGLIPDVASPAYLASRSIYIYSPTCLLSITYVLHGSIALLVILNFLIHDVFVFFFVLDMQVLGGWSLLYIVPRCSSLLYASGSNYGSPADAYCIIPSTEGG